MDKQSQFRDKMGIIDDKATFSDIDYLLFCLRKEIGLVDNDCSNTIWAKITNFMLKFLRLNFLLGERKNARLQIIIKDDLQIFFGKSIKLLPLKIINFMNKVVVLYFVGGITSMIIRSINIIRIMLNKKPISYKKIQVAFQDLENYTKNQFKK